MKFLRLGFVAAFVLALSGQAFAAAPAAPKIDPKAQAQGMKEAPAVLQGAGVDCALSDALFLGQGDAKVAGKSVKTSIYEAACGAGMGYILIATPGADSQAFDCLTLKEDNDKKLAAKQKGGTLCMLPGNADPKMGLAPLLAKGGASCSPITGAHWLGASPTDKISLFETSCGNGPGYIITIPMQGSTKPLDVTQCMKSVTVGVDCTLTTPAQIEQSILKLSDAAGKPACKPTKARWVVSDPATKNDYYEVGCADGSTGYMFQTEANGSFKVVIECVRATRIAGGCTLSSADSGQTAEAGTYTKLAKQVSYPCNVSKYQSYGAETGGPREIVELACTDHPDGAFAIVPTGNGQTGEYFNCLRAQGRGLACRLSPIEATYAKISSEIAARGKTTCQVNGGRGIGKDTKGSEYVEVTCAAGPGLVLEYSRLPEETLVSALPCNQAAIADACKLQKK
ncbi:MAG: hypothetical protein WDN45_09525 [Caulobacteraceae bacterium]